MQEELRVVGLDGKVREVDAPAKVGNSCVRRKFPRPLLRGGRECHDGRVIAGEIEGLVGEEQRYEVPAQDPESAQKRQPVHHIVAAIDDVVAPEPGRRHTPEPEVMGQRSTGIVVGQTLGERHLVAHAYQFETAPEMVRRHQAVLDLGPNGTTAVVVREENPPAVASQGR